MITSRAFVRIADDDTVRYLTERIIRGEDIDDEVVDETFASAPLDRHIEADIVDLAALVGRSGLLAVRSSATVEDLSGASFAGQYRSILDVDSTDPQALMAAVRKVWASLWHRAPAVYRQAFSIDPSSVAMAVVLMRMIPATTAGVVFTRDPSGAEGARVESVDGLAESFVSGQNTPSAWVVDSTTVPSAVPAPARIALELSQRIEEAAGVPQDVEWAAIGDDVWIVQARPITVLDDHDGFDTPIDDHELTTAGIAELMPGVLAPLGWALNQFMLEEAFRSVLDDLGVVRGSEHEDRRLVRRVRGRAAVDFDQLRAIAGEVPGAVEQLEEQYFGTLSDGTTDRTTTRNRSRLARTWLELQSLRTQRVVIDAADVVVQSVQRIRPRRPALSVASDTWLLA